MKMGVSATTCACTEICKSGTLAQKAASKDPRQEALAAAESSSGSPRGLQVRPSSLPLPPPPPEGTSTAASLESALVPRSSTKDSCASERSTFSELTLGADSAALSSAAPSEAGAAVSERSAAVSASSGEDWQPTAGLRAALQDGRFNATETAQLQAELHELDDSSLARAFDYARRWGRQKHGPPPQLRAPRQLHWAKGVPKLHAGASVTDAMATPGPILAGWKQNGLGLLKASKVAVVLLCGGSGGRFESGGRGTPKPIADVGLLSGKSLLQLHCERVLRLRHIVERAGDLHTSGGSSGSRCRIPVCVLTNADSCKAIEQHIRDRDHFGLPPEDIHIMVQAMEPLFDRNGDVLLSSGGVVARSPGGNGVVVKLLQAEGLLSKFRRMGIASFFVCSSDNILARMADPVLLGYASALAAPAVLKVASRSHVEDELGVFCTYRDVNRNQELCARVVEQFEVRKEVRTRKATFRSMCLPSISSREPRKTLGCHVTRCLSRARSLRHSGSAAAGRGIGRSRASTEVSAP